MLTPTTRHHEPPTWRTIDLELVEVNTPSVDILSRRQRPCPTGSDRHAVEQFADAVPGGLSIANNPQGLHQSHAPLDSRSV